MQFLSEGTVWHELARFSSVQFSWHLAFQVQVLDQFISVAAAVWGSPAEFACGWCPALLPPPGPPQWYHWRNKIDLSPPPCSPSIACNQYMSASARTWGTPGRPSRCVKDPSHTSPIPVSAATPPLKIPPQTKMNCYCPKVPAREKYSAESITNDHRNLSAHRIQCNKLVLLRYIKRFSWQTITSSHIQAITRQVSSTEPQNWNYRLTSSDMSSAMLSAMGFLGGNVRQVSRPRPIGGPRTGGGAEGARGGCPGNSLSLSVFAIWSTEHDWSSSAPGPTPPPPPRLNPSPRPIGETALAAGILTSVRSG